MAKLTEYVAIAQVAATTQLTQPDQTNQAHPGVKVVLDTTVFGSGITLTIQGKDRDSGKYFTLLAGAEVAANNTKVYTVYPKLTAVGNVTASDVLPETWRVKVVPTVFAVTVVNQGTKTFTVAGDQTLRFLAAATIRVTGSTGNDGLYTIVSSTFSVDHTDIVVVQAIPSATADGSLASAATYTVGAHLLV